MEHTPPGRHHDVHAFRAHWRGLDPAFDCVDATRGKDGPLGAPIEVAGARVANRFAVQPMEGWDGTRDGLPSELTRRRWRRFGRSGAKLVWGGEAFAVSEDGRANPNQLFLNDRADVAGALVALREEIEAGHREVGEDPAGLVIGLQLTHSGRFARPDGPPAPRLAYRHPVLDARVGAAGRELTDAELEAIGERFVRAAKVALAAGFRFVDVKCCHGYLLHELLSARSRPGRYGGDLDGRTRLVLRIVAAIRAECPGLAVGARISMSDAFPHSPDPQTRIGAPIGLERHRPYRHGFGLDPDDPTALALEEPLGLIARLRALGVRLVNTSLGSPYYSPHLIRPATHPPSDGYLPPEDPLLGVQRHLRVTRAVKAAFPDLVVVGSGWSYLQEWLPNVAEWELGRGHAEFAGLGRMMLSYPELPLDVLAGRPLDRRRICRTFSDCTSAPRNGLVSGCYPLDPWYRALPERETLQAIKMNRTHRQR